MNAIALNSSGKIDPGSLAIYATVTAASASLDLPMLIVGAAARDLALHYGYGARIKRATLDIDFAVQVPYRQAYDQLRAALKEPGFTETKIHHRLLSPEDLRVDIIPFGTIEDKEEKNYLAAGWRCHDEHARFQGGIGSRSKSSHTGTPGTRNTGRDAAGAGLAAINCLD